jgi:hypothetical protein
MATKKKTTKKREQTDKERAEAFAPDAVTHRVAQERGIDPMGILGRGEPATSPTKPEPPYSR